MRDAKMVGDYEATVHFHKEVEVIVPVKVVAEGTEATAPAQVEEVVEEVAKTVEETIEEAPVAEEETPEAE